MMCHIQKQTGEWFQISFNPLYSCTKKKKKNRGQWRRSAGSRRLNRISNALIWDSGVYCVPELSCVGREQGRVHPSKLPVVIAWCSVSPSCVTACCTEAAGRKASEDALIDLVNILHREQKGGGKHGRKKLHDSISWQIDTQSRFHRSTHFNKSIFGNFLFTELIAISF